ncbi:MAG: protein kinase [Candidatus Sumerlaeaceae bacterium]|nr:protein kinase [Candidatus Sumerlaeaceae bacterium]
MNRSILRSLYNVCFWLGAAGLAYANRDVFDKQIRPSIEGVFKMYSTVVLIFGAIVIGIALNYLREAIMHTTAAIYGRIFGPITLNLEGGDHERNVMKAARRLEKKGDFAGAGEAYEALQIWDECARNFQKGGLLTRAAQAWERFGDRAKAMELYENDGNFEMAAIRCTEEGLRDRAQKNYRLAAELAYEANTFAKAAEFYEKAGDFNRAGRVFEDLKRDVDALRCYEKSANTERIETLIERLDPAQLAVAGEASAALVTRSAELFMRTGNYLKAAEILEQASDFVRAAEAYEKADEWEKAGETYLKGKQHAKAITAYERVSDTRKVADFRARLAMQQGDWVEAGKQYAEAEKPNQAVDAFKRAKDFSAAARVYESMKRYLMAADMYSAAKDFRLAGEAYSKAHDWRNAAECYLVCGEKTQAMEAYVAAGNYFQAGRIAAEESDTAHALEYLQRVPQSSPDWKVATGLLACVFYDTNRHDTARDLFERIIDQISPANDTIVILYKYSLLMERVRPDLALSALRRIMTVNVNYEDVRLRVEALERLNFSTPAPRDRVHTAPTAERTISSEHRAASTIRVESPTESSQVRATRIATLLPETRVGENGRYRILHELGRGEKSVVYKAVDQNLQQEIALKILAPSSGMSTGDGTRFHDQARIVARLSHPNLVPIYDAGRSEGTYYLAMEYVAGETLRNVVKRKGPMSLEDARRIVRQLVDALNYAHSESVLHLDLKPANILVRESGEAKLCDLGVAAMVNDYRQANSEFEDSQLALVESPQYLAPEQILHSGVDARTDVYALGLSLFYFLTGRTPFEVRKISDPVEIARVQLHSSFPRPSTLRATLPSKADEIFMKCTQKNPEDRYQSIGDFMADFVVM